VREVYALDATDEQLEHIERALRRNETWRAEWIEEKDKPKKKAEKDKASNDNKEGNRKKGTGEAKDSDKETGKAGAPVRKRARKPAGGDTASGGGEKKDRHE
jgi:phage repressor protein C with HTH and peptisase S24 domain